MIRRGIEKVEGDGGGGLTSYPVSQHRTMPGSLTRTEPLPSDFAEGFKVDLVCRIGEEVALDQTPLHERRLESGSAASDLVNLRLTGQNRISTYISLPLSSMETHFGKELLLM